MRPLPNYFTNYFFYFALAILTALRKFRWNDIYREILLQTDCCRSSASSSEMNKNNKRRIKAIERVVGTELKSYNWSVTLSLLSTIDEQHFIRRITAQIFYFVSQTVIGWVMLSIGRKGNARGGKLQSWGEIQRHYRYRQLFQLFQSIHWGLVCGSTDITELCRFLHPALPFWTFRELCSFFTSQLLWSPALPKWRPCSYSRCEIAMWVVVPVGSGKRWRWWRCSLIEGTTESSGRRPLTRTLCCRRQVVGPPALEDSTCASSPRQSVSHHSCVLSLHAFVL